MKIIVKHKKKKEIFENKYYSNIINTAIFPLLIVGILSCSIIPLTINVLFNLKKPMDPSMLGIILVIILFTIFFAGYLVIFFKALRNEAKEIILNIDKNKIKSDKEYRFKNFYYKVESYMAGRLGVDFQYVIIKVDYDDMFKMYMDLVSFIVLKEYIDKNTKIEFIKD